MFDDDRVVLLELLHVRSSDGATLDDLTSSFDDSGENLKATVSWRLEGKSISLDWDLRGRQVTLTGN